MAKHKYYWSKIQKWSSTTSNLRVPKNSTYGTAKSSSYPLETCLLADPPYNSFFLPNLCSCDSPMVAFKIRPQIFFHLGMHMSLHWDYGFSTIGGIYFFYSGLALWLPVEGGIDDIMIPCNFAFNWRVYIET